MDPQAPRVDALVNMCQNDPQIAQALPVDLAIGRVVAQPGGDFAHQFKGPFQDALLGLVREELPLGPQGDVASRFVRQLAQVVEEVVTGQARQASPLPFGCAPRGVSPWGANRQGPP